MGVLSKYYKVLSLPETASQSEIKRKYRQLVMRYHPDKSGGSQEKFIAITEAYEYLTGKKKDERETIRTYSPSRSTSSARNQPVEERVKRAKQQYKEAVYQEYVEKDAYFRKITSGNKWKLLKLSSIIGAIIVFVLVVDLLLPKRYETDRIIAFDGKTIGSLVSQIDSRKFYLESGKSFYFENNIIYLYANREVTIVQSFIFHNNLRAQVITNSEIKKIRIEYELGALSYLLIPFFLLPSIILFFQRRTYTYILFYFISLYLCTPLMIYYLFSSDRLLHLFTLGFW